MKTDSDPESDAVSDTPATNGGAAKAPAEAKPEDADVAKAEENGTPEPAAKAGDDSPGEPETPADDPAAEDLTDKPAAEDDTSEVTAAEPVVDPEPAAPVASAEPTVSDEPVASAEPTVSDDSDEPVASDESDEPTASDEPATSGEADGSKGFLADLFPPKTGKAWAVVALVLVVLAGLGWGGYKWFNTLPDGVAFRVDGVDVTEQQLEEQTQTLSALYGVQPPGPEDPAKQDAFRKDVAKSTAVAMAIDNAAAERKVVVADRQAQDFLTKYITATYGEGQAGRDAFVKDLADKNTSEPKVLAEVKRQMTMKQLFGQIAGDTPVTDDEVKQAFDNRKAEFATPERREIHNIVVKTRPEADALIGELKGGANFEALATQRSLDELTKASGGNLGLVTARDLQKDYSDAAFAAPVGGLVGPVETLQKSGPMYNVGKVVQAQPSTPADFDKVKEGVRRLLFAERADAKWRAFMEEQIKVADIKYAEKYQPADPSGLPPIGNEPGAPGAPR